MSLLAKYQGTVRAVIATVRETDPVTGVTEDKEYWVEMKKHLSGEAWEQITEEMTSTQVNEDKEVETKVRQLAGVREELCRAIIAWNIDDGKGGILPYSPPEVLDQSLRDLPQALRKKIYEALNKAQEEDERSPDEQADFTRK